MIADLVSNLSDFANPAQLVALAGVGAGALLLVFGAAGALAGPAPNIRRLQSIGKRPAHADYDLVRGADQDPDGFLKAFVPRSKSERSKLALTMRRAGIQNEHAVRNFVLVRAVFGLALPFAFLALMFLPPEAQASLGVERLIGANSGLATLQIATALLVLGFYGPTLWLRLRVRRRKRLIEESFPNALDLLQISIEAGLGFDAAMVRVANELSSVAPAIAEEFMMLQLEIQAGKDRDRAFNDMVNRTDVTEIASFATAIQQATQLGTNVSQALDKYATGMRLDRILRAEQKANRLPVQMSAVMAAFMMPIMLMITLFPILIRWINMLAET